MYLQHLFNLYSADSLQDIASCCAVRIALKTGLHLRVQNKREIVDAAITMAKSTSITRRSFLAATGLTSLRSALAIGKGPSGSQIVACLGVHPDTPSIDWAVPSLPYRILVEVPPDEIGARKAGRMPASLELDFTSAEFSSLRLPGPVDLDSIQILRYDSTTGKVLPAYERPAQEVVRLSGAD